MFALLFLICALLSIVLLSLLISFLYVVPKHLEDIARLARKIYLQIEDEDEENI